MERDGLQGEVIAVWAMGAHDSSLKKGKECLIHLEMIPEFFVQRNISVRIQCVLMCAFISASAVSCFIVSFFH